MPRRLIAAVGAMLALAACTDPARPTLLDPGAMPLLSLSTNAGGTPGVVTVGSTLQLVSSLHSSATLIITWTTSNPAAATVTSSGVVTGVSVGTAVVTADNGYGRESATITVTAPATIDTATVVASAVPVAMFGVSCAAGSFVCTLDASATTGATSYAWDLGREPNPNASGVTATTDYYHGDARTVVLTVAGPGGSASITRRFDPATPWDITTIASSSTPAATTASAPPATTPTPTPITDPAPALSAGSVPGPELPRAYVNTAMPAVTGTTRTVSAGQDLQAVINAAQPGDLIALQPGATFVGNFVLPNKGGSSWITIAAASGAALPAPGTRVTPSYAGGMPKLVAPNSDPTLATAAGAHHYRLVGIEVSVSPSAPVAYTLVALGAGSSQTSLAQVPHDIVLDRMYIHGSATMDLRRCVALNSATTAIVDSYLSDCHSRDGDAQAIAGWNGPGPYKIVNNYLEGAGENVMFGGADPAIVNLIPGDIEIRRNHFFKPLAWQSAGWTVKNLFELKNAQRVLVEGNVFENCWNGGQNGFALVWKSVNQDGTAPWSQTSDVTFQYNIVRRVGGGLNVMGKPESAPAIRAARFRVANNLFESIDGSNGNAGRLWQVFEAVAVDFAHNTGVAPNAGLLFVGAPVSGGFSVRDNIFGGYGGINSADGQGAGTQALNYHVPGWFVAGNMVIGSAAGAVPFPTNNLYPSSASAGGLSYDLRPISAPAIGAFTTDGQPLGADRVGLEQRTAGVAMQ